MKKQKINKFATDDFKKEPDNDLGNNKLSDPPNEGINWPKRILRFGIALFPFLFICLIVLSLMEPNSANRWIYMPDMQLINKQIIKDHYAAIIGLPLAAIFAVWVVMSLKNKDGQMEFKLLGVSFKGQAGQVVLWIFCFLTIVLAIKLVW